MFTYDGRLASGFWGSGATAALRQRMADYLVDGVRLGTIPWPTRSGSPDDLSLDKSGVEILAAALTLALLGYKNVEIRAHDSQGVSLEKPDLEATIDGRLVGIEMADVPGKSKHDALVNRIRVALGERLRNDPAFRTALGQYHLSVKLSGFGAHGARELEGNREADALVEELSRFIPWRHAEGSHGWI